MEKLDPKITNLMSDLNAALDRLDESLMEAKTELIRDAVIQRFEFCFELCWKTMRGVNTLFGLTSQSPRDAIRTSAQNGLINNPEKWFEYLKARNLSSHTYNEEQADLVYSKAKEFAISAREFIELVNVKLHG